jgi:hypothetical protein
MKTKELIKEKKSVIEELRTIRDQISIDLLGKNIEEIQKYISQRSFLFEKQQKDKMHLSPSIKN